MSELTDAECAAIAEFQHAVTPRDCDMIRAGYAAALAATRSSVEEPVAWLVWAKGGKFTRGIYQNQTPDDFAIWAADGDRPEPLYARPTPAPASEVEIDDGENLAVRSFLMGYGMRPGTVASMRVHMENCGHDKCWPAWVDDTDAQGHLTKAGAQDWLRFLFNAERATPPASDEVRRLVNVLHDARRHAPLKQAQAISAAIRYLEALASPESAPEGAK